MQQLLEVDRKRIPTGILDHRVYVVVANLQVELLIGWYVYQIDANLMWECNLMNTENEVELARQVTALNENVEWCRRRRSLHEHLVQSAALGLIHCELVCEATLANRYHDSVCAETLSHAKHFL